MLTEINRFHPIFLSKRDFGTCCENCNTLWVHGMCRCDNLIRIGCDCEKCETPTPEPVIFTMKDVKIVANEMFGEWVVEVTAAKKNFWGRIPSDDPRMIRVVGEGYIWKNMDTMQHVTAHGLKTMLREIHKKLF